MNYRGGFNGGFGGANLGQLMKQAQKMQADMERAKAELQAQEFESVVGGGMVRVVMM
ncbi:MAG: YbaB/EbfC family nucleoid-associated protein, partial [Clostridia bacterium]|nr:YbaB/EbfC family nucleoid-associated protein [Clostridia bacterium]